MDYSRLDCQDSAFVTRHFAHLAKPAVHRLECQLVSVNPVQRTSCLLASKEKIVLVM